VGAGGNVMWDGVAFRVPGIHAKAGIPVVEGTYPRFGQWIPAFAGMTMASDARVWQIAPPPAIDLETTRMMGHKRQQSRTACAKTKMKAGG